MAVPATSGSRNEPAGRAFGRALILPVRALHRVVRWLLVLALATVLIFTVGQVVDRYLIRSAFNAHDQYARLGLVLVTFVGIAVGIRDRVNVRIELVGHLTSAAVRQRVGRVLDAVMLVVAAFLVIVGSRLLEIGASQPILGTPFTYRTMYIELIVGMTLVALFLILRFVDRLCGGRARLDIPSNDDHRA